MSFRVLAFFTWIFTIAGLLNDGVADQFRTSSWAPFATISDSISSATTVAPAHSVRWLLKATSTDTGTISSATEVATTAAPVVLEGRADSTDITGNATAMSILNKKSREAGRCYRCTLEVDWCIIRRSSAAPSSTRHGRSLTT